MKKKEFAAAGILCITVMLMAGCGDAKLPASETAAQTVQSTPEETVAQTVKKTSGNTEAEAKEAALKDAGVDEKEALAISVHKDYDDGREAYEVSIYTEDKDFEYTIDAVSGAVLEKEAEMVPKLTADSSDVKIKQEDVKKILFDKVPGAADKNLRLSLEYEDGHMIYEGEIIYEAASYDFEIDAQTGKLLEWHEEKL